MQSLKKVTAHGNTEVVLVNCLLLSAHVTFLGMLCEPQKKKLEVSEACYGTPHYNTLRGHDKCSSKTRKTGFLS